MASQVRYRLRFMLQELDLQPGATLLGRSSDCQITIEDPLVSRQHARIELHDGRAVLHDLGSRNGVKLNGITLRDQAVLGHGDRIRVGTQEFVFSRVEGGGESRVTGFLRHCAGCRMPYPEEAGSCPNCGSTEWLEETLTATASERRGWELALLVEMIERSLGRGQRADAEKLLRRASTEVEACLAGERLLNESLVTELTRAVGQFTVAEGGEPTWACWLLRLFRRLPFAPNEAMRNEIARMQRAFPVEVGEVLDELRAHYRSSADPVGADALEQAHRRRALERVR